MRASLARLRNHVVTGFIFVMPVLITVAVIEKFWSRLLAVGGKLSKLLRVHTLLGPSGDAVMAIAFFLLVCIAAGYLVRFSFLKRISERIDERLSDLVPGYSQVRAETKRKVGVEPERETVFPACLLKVHDLWQPGYVIEELPDGTQTVFVPRAPAVGSGQVYVADPSQLKRLTIDSAALNTRLRQLGKGMLHAAHVQDVDAFGQAPHPGGGTTSPSPH
jgi:uncharacterized membrane protein